MNSPLAQLRLALVEARAAWRAAQDDYKLTKAHAEQQAVADGVNGKNADEREWNLLVAVSADLYHNRALATLRNTEHTIDRIEAQIESLLDDRRAWEWSIRSAMVDALGSQGKDDATAFDGAMDDAGLARCEAFGRAPVAADAAADINELFSR